MDFENEEDLYPSVKNAIMKTAEKEGYISYDMNITLISTDGGNCFGMLYEINIKGDTVKGKQETNIFVKQMTPNVENIKLLSVSEIYNKEIFVYTELAKIFNELQDEANIPVTKRFKLVKLYDESNNDALLLEDMTKKGFKTCSRNDVMTVNYAELCLENLAQLHGLAFVIEKKLPEYHESKIKSLKQSLVTDTDYKNFASKIYEFGTRKLSSDMKFKTDKWWKNALEDYSKYMQGTMTTVKCFCHGDFKSNNIMYKEIEGKITEVITVDYQLAHYGSPILDLVYFICMGTEQKFRRKHLSHLKDYYHTALTKYLEHFDISVDNCYPRTMFEKDFEDCIDYGLVSCVCVLPFVLGTEEGVPEFIDTDIVHIGLKFGDNYYDRLQGVFEDFFKFEV